jgi:hypothetical protein
MDSVIRNVKDIDSADRLALEHVLGGQLQENQQLVIRVVTLSQQQSNPDQRGESPAVPALPDWCNVYDGLSEQEIAEIEKIALTRANLSRPSPNL